MNATDAAAARERVEPAPKRVLFIGKDERLGTALKEGLQHRQCDFDIAAGNADALRRLRRTHYHVVITDPATSIEEDLALLTEIRRIRPGVGVIMLAPASTPEEVIAALRARVFLCMSPPFDPEQLADYAARAADAVDAALGIEVLSAHRNWVSLRINCQLLTAERVIAFLKELRTDLDECPREELLMGFREILLNAMEHGAKFQAGKVIDVAAVRTARAVVFYVLDPGPGFRREDVEHAAVGNPEQDPTRHVAIREAKAMRPGGFGILMAQGVVDELIYSEVGNEVLMIKHTA